MITIFRKFHTTTSAFKTENVNRQAKIFQKLFGQRQKGSKKKWFPSENSPQLITATSITKTKNVGKNALRRVSVLSDFSLISYGPLNISKFS